MPWPVVRLRASLLSNPPYSHRRKSQCAGLNRRQAARAAAQLPADTRQGQAPCPILARLTEGRSAISPGSIQSLVLCHEGDR